jgi:long-chain acyl-CoA synthetase
MQAAPTDVAPEPLPTLDLQATFGGTRLFLLGGTGFLGKVFWVMLLDRCPQVAKIFMLVRSGKGLTSEERFWKDIASSDCMKPLRDRHADDASYRAWLEDKIVPIDGDVGRPLCGIDASLIQELRGTIDAVVNVAGIVDFNPPLDEALDANAFGAQNLVALAKALGDAPLMHTSTCYVAGRRKGPIKEIDPRLHPFPRCEELGREMWDPDREIAECLDLIAQAKHRCDDAFRQSEFAEAAKKNLIRKGEPTKGAAYDAELARVKRKFMSERLIESGLDRATHWGWPNIYTYTKSIGEQVIARSGLAFTLARPACCETTLDFPIRGWNEGITTSSPIIVLALKGQVNVPGRHVPLDFIPTDWVTAGMILALAELLEGTHKAVYQFGTSDVNPATAVRLGELIGLYKRKYWQRKGGVHPLLKLYGTYFEAMPVTPERFNAVGPPAIAAATKGASDFLRKTGVPMFAGAAKALAGVSSQEEKIASIMTLFIPFTSDLNGPFDCANTRAAFARLSPEDKTKLPWCPETLDWMDWMHNIHMPAVEKLILPEMEKKMVREVKPLRAHETLVTLVDQMAERHDLAVALQRFEADGFTRITFADVRARAWAVAARLAVAGVKKGDRVILSGKNDPAWAIAYFGILAAGATVVPVDAALELDAVLSIVKESGARIALLDRDLALGAGVKVCDLHESAEPDPDAGVHGGVAPAPGVEVLPSDIASLIYTSGTTGKPKGVMLTHANFTSLIAALAPIFPLGSGDRVLSVLPLHHTFEFTCGLLLPFSRGARIAYLDELTGDRLSAGLAAGRITAMVGVPALWQLLERRILSQVHAKGKVAEGIFHWAGQLNRMLGKSVGLDAGKLLFGPVHEALGGHVKYLISGGAALPKETQQLFSGLGLHLTEGYGLTEAAPVLTVSKPSPRSPAGQVGKPLPGMQIKIDAPDDQGVGEILAKGPSIMAGYTDPEATARVLSEDGWLKTGDLGKLDKQGRLQIVGRSKDVIVTTTGENVYPDDVEKRLGTVRGIAELAIVGVEAKGGEKVACLAVPATEDGLSIPPSGGRAPGSDEDAAPVSLPPAQMRAERMERAMRSLREAISKLPYGQQPSVVHLYDAPLPRTATRKVRRTEVQAILRRMIAATTLPEGADASVGVVRLAIAAVSGRALSEIHGDATLQGDLGFDSLMLTELLEALENKGDAIDPGALQACRTVDDVERLAGDRSVGGARGSGSQRGLARKSSTTRIEGKNADLPLLLPPAVQEQAKAIIGRFQNAFYGQVMRPRVTGRAFIPHNRNTIVVANHASHLDMGFVRYALGTYGEDIISLAAQDYFFEGGLQRAFFENLTNLKAFDRKSGLRQSLRQAGEVLEQGKTVLIFPEGTRSSTGEVEEFKPMVGYLALTHGVDILPLYIGGTHASMPKGGVLPMKREITARIGVPLRVTDMRRLTTGMTAQDAAREVARLARNAVVALGDGKLLDTSTATNAELTVEREHPLVGVFAELEEKFLPGRVDRPTSFYFTLGGDAFAKWTVRVDALACEIKLGKPENGTADCVLKTSAEIFTKIVRESYVPGPQEFLSGAVKSNDVALLQTFQKAFQLDG